MIIKPNNCTTNTVPKPHKRKLKVKQNTKRVIALAIQRDIKVHRHTHTQLLIKSEKDAINIYYRSPPIKYTHYTVSKYISHTTTHTLPTTVPVHMHDYSCSYLL